MDRDSPGQKWLCEHYGVSRMPTPLPPVRMNEFYPREYLGSGRSSPVLVTFDLSATGEAENVQAILPPPLPANVEVRAVLVGPDGEEMREYEPARELDPLFAAAVEAGIRAMRFSPAERDGEPVPFPGMRMTVVMSEPKGEADSTGS